MKKYFLCFAALFFTGFLKAQHTGKQTTGVFDKGLAWTTGDNPVLPTNPETKALPKISATATCFCVVDAFNLTDLQSRMGPCLDLTATVNTTYSGLNPEKDDNVKDCNNKCSVAALQLTAAQKQAIADCVCGFGIANGTIIQAYSAVGTKRYRVSQSIGTLTNLPELKTTTCQCPSGWAANTTNVDGGVTADGKCKKAVCGPFSLNPPANGTAVGDWGFTWGNALYAWGSAANGGAAKCTTVVTRPRQCTLQ